MMIKPGVSADHRLILGLIVPLIFIGFLKWQLLLTPLLFTVVFIFLLRRYMRKMDPVAGASCARSSAR